ncbi:MAG: hypothetical protein Q7R33_01795 [Nitrosarchaeum sp.]|nr:hypothetical protein [Nitrosarchaeum sp.]
MNTKNISAKSTTKKRYPTMQLDPMVARALDEAIASNVPLIKLKFKKNVKIPKNTKKILKKIFETMRPQLEIELVMKMTSRMSCGPEEI